MTGSSRVGERLLECFPLAPDSFSFEVFLGATELVLSLSFEENEVQDGARLELIPLELVSRSSAVLRDGNVLQLPPSELVEGDTVIVKARDVIHADMRLVEASLDFSVDVSTHNCGNYLAVSMG